MVPLATRLWQSLRISLILLCAQASMAQATFIRVNQAGYEASSAPFRAYVMSTTASSGETFSVINTRGKIVHSGTVGALLGVWGHSNRVSYNVYAIDFNVPAGDVYTIKVSGSAKAASPVFAVDTADNLYAGLLLNTLFFYQTQRDGKHFVPNALRTAPGHLKDSNAKIYLTPPLDSNDFIDTAPPTAPLVLAGLPNIDASGGWWDA